MINVMSQGGEDGQTLEIDTDKKQTKNISESPPWVKVRCQNHLHSPGSMLIFVTKFNIRIPQDQYYSIRPC